MTTLERISRTASLAAQSAASLAKAALLSRKTDAPPATPPQRGLVVLGNGPSLRQTIDRHGDLLRCHDLMAVNFAALTDDFTTLRPTLYVLADPHFFDATGTDRRVDELWRRLRDTDWPMTLFVPARRRRQAAGLLGDDSHVSTRTFNLTPAEGFRPLRHFLYRRGIAMPRPRNVLIVALMTALRLRYRSILVAGADHSWSRTLWVDDDNCVVSVQPHFYPDKDDELKRVRSEYAGYHLHDIYTSLAIAFRSYFDIAGYARTLGAEIVNITPGSFIDAFPRMNPATDAPHNQTPPPTVIKA